jgi:hypothetical protein
LQNASLSLDEQRASSKETPSQNANLGGYKQLINSPSSAASKIEDVMLTALAEAMAAEFREEGREKREEIKKAEGEPLTQEEAERIYEEMMGNE